MRFECYDLPETLCFFRINGASAAEKSRLARAAVSGVIALAGNLPGIARAMRLMVPGDVFFSVMMLCYCVLHVLRHFLHWNCCVQRMCSTVVCCHIIVFCNSVSADRSGLAASRSIVAAGVCVILLHFAAESRKLR